MAQMMRAAIFVEKGRVVLDDKPVPESGLLDAFSAGLSDKSTCKTVCPGDKKRMRRMQDVISSGRVDLSGLVTHRFKLDQIEEAYELFANQCDGVLKVAITP